MTLVDCIPPDEILAGSEVRELCGRARLPNAPTGGRLNRGGAITRKTLLDWIRDASFPPPFKEIPGPGAGGRIGLWDRREVKAWLKAERRRRRDLRR